MHFLVDMQSTYGRFELWAPLFQLMPSMKGGYGDVKNPDANNEKYLIKIPNQKYL
jgi:hypothetical protein